MKLMDRTKAARNEARRTTRDARRAIAGDGNRIGWFGSMLLGLASAATGAIVAFLADPARGRARRARLMDQGAATVKHAARQIGRSARSVSSLAAGRLNEARYGGQSVAPIDDVTLRDRAESQLFRDSSIAKGDLNLSVERGILVLRGEVADDAMRQRLVRDAEKIDGIWSVRNLLHLPGEEAASEELVGVTTR